MSFCISNTSLWYLYHIQTKNSWKYTLHTFFHTESSYVDSSYDDSSIFDRDDSLRENGTLSGETRHQFSVQKRSNANSVTLFQIHHCDIYIIYKQKIAENIHYIHFSIQIVLISDKNWPKPLLNRDFKWNINGTLSGETRHQFAVQKRSNANSVTLPSTNSKNQTMKAGNII
jgi:hypothetical protein